jgi:hypothetical protein
VTSAKARRIPGLRAGYTRSSGGKLTLVGVECFAARA